jgi:hypothetical protein
VVTIRSHLKNAVELKIHQMVDNGDGVGVQVARQVGDAVVLRPGRNDVDGDWWDKWLSQHRGTPLAASFTVEP